MDATARAAARPRAAIFVPVFGASSEIWTIRQCIGFRRVNPIVVCWQRHPDAPEDDHGLSVIQLDAAWHRRRSLVTRVASRLGSAWSELPGATERGEIAKVLRATGVDVALCHFGWTALRVASAVGSELPIVWHVHGRDVSVSLRSAAHRAALRKLLPTATEVVVVASFQLDTLRRLGLPPDRGVLIPCGAPFEQFAAAPLPERRDGPIRYITVGRLASEKGILETIQAFARVHREHPDSELVIVGDGPLSEPAAELARELGVAGPVRSTGQLAPEHVADELRAAHVFVQHSRSHEGSIEGSSVALTEAGASGLPLVVSRLGGNVEQVEDDQNGILFEPGDLGAQARAMLRFAQDEALRRRMGTKAREIAARFDSARQIQKLEDVLLRAAARSSPRAAEYRAHAE